MFTAEEQELLLDLLQFNRECQEDNLDAKEIDLPEFDARVKLIDSIISKL